jgi:hypothetical protein
LNPDLGVLHAGQGATAAVLLAGKPLVQVPLVLEQKLTAEAVERLGAGVTASPADVADVARKLDAVLADDRYAAAAGAFAATHFGFDAASQVERMVARVAETLEGVAGRARAPRPIPGATPLRNGPARAGGRVPRVARYATTGGLGGFRSGRQRTRRHGHDLYMARFLAVCGR